MEIPKKINGGIFSNNLGTIKFVNDFDLKSYKRFYNITLPRKNIIRAFHGHLKEGKAVFVTSGSLLLCSVKIDHKVKPNKKNKVKKYITKVAVTQNNHNSQGICQWCHVTGKKYKCYILSQINP